MAWLVTYRLHHKASAIRSGADHAGLMPQANVILRSTHPVTWAAAPSDRFTTYLLFFAEIPDDVAESADHWCTVED